MSTRVAFYPINPYGPSVVPGTRIVGIADDLEGSIYAVVEQSDGVHRELDIWSLRSGDIAPDGAEYAGAVAHHGTTWAFYWR